MLIDDNTNVILQAKKFLSSGKIFVMPDYKCSMNVDGDNIHHVKTTVSDLKPQDFSIAALELKAKQLEKELKTAERERDEKQLKP